MDQEISEVLEQNPSDLPQLGPRVIELRPTLGKHSKEFRRFCRVLIKTVIAAGAAGRHAALERSREEIQSFAIDNATRGRLALMFSCSVVVDMVAQGWEVWVGHKTVRLKSPSTEGVSPEELKQRIRNGHLLERDAQLREPSVRAFVKQMEQKRLGPKGWVSVFFADARRP